MIARANETIDALNSLYGVGGVLGDPPAAAVLAADRLHCGKTPSERRAAGNPMGASAIFRLARRWKHGCTLRLLARVVAGGGVVQPRPPVSARRGRPDLCGGFRGQGVAIWQGVRGKNRDPGPGESLCGPHSKAPVYAGLLRRLIDLGMVELSPVASSEGGLFSVWNKKRAQRMIIGARTVESEVQRTSRHPYGHMGDGGKRGAHAITQRRVAASLCGGPQTATSTCVASSGRPCMEGRRK